MIDVLFLLGALALALVGVAKLSMHAYNAVRGRAIGDVVGHVACPGAVSDTPSPAPGHNQDTQETR